MATLRQRLGELEANLRADWLAGGYARQPHLVRHAFHPVGSEVAMIATNPHVDTSLREADRHPGALR